MAKNRKRKRETESVAETLCSFGRYLCDIVISIYMCVILAVLPLYNNGYAQIGTDKENFFRKTIIYGGTCLLPVFLLWLLFRIITAVQKKQMPAIREIPVWIREHLTTTDKFAVLYAIAVLLSYLFTNYRDEALWGTASWRMGMWTQLGAVIVYFMISKMWKRKDWIAGLVLPVSAIVFFLGYMNKFQLCLVDKDIINSSFISTIGNINWYCGYLVTVLFGGVYLLWKTGAEFHWKKVILMVYVAIGFATLITQGSSSGIVAFMVMMFVLFGMSVKDSEKMECFWLEMVLFSGACLITYVLRKTNVFSQEVLQERMTDVLTFSIVSVILVFVSAGMLCLVHGMRKRKYYPEKAFVRFYRILCIIIPAGVAALLLFTLANTVSGGALTPGMNGAAMDTTGSAYSNGLMFSTAWGSNRGATWAAGARCFWEADLLHKIFGVGPDCMYVFLTNEGSDSLQTMVYNTFGGSRLTNAHNEWLTILVNMGVLGLVSYAGMMVSAIRNFLRAGKRSALAGACGFCVLAYTVNNMFSFQQVMNISAVFVIMGIGGNVWRSVQAEVSRSS